MTTLRDYLKDFAKDIATNEYNGIHYPNDVRDTDDIIEEYLDIIKERIVG